MQKETLVLVGNGMAGVRALEQLLKLAPVLAGRFLYSLQFTQIDLASGKAMASDEGCTHSYPVKVENGRVFRGLLKQEEVA